MKKCPYCSKYLMNARAVICIHCGRNVVTGEAIPTAMPSKKPSAAPPPRVSSVSSPPKTPSAPLPPKISSGYSFRKIVYAAKFIGAAAFLIFACVCLFYAYSNYNTQNAGNAAAKAGGASAGNRLVSVPPVLAGNAVETEEKKDEAMAEKMLKAIVECNCDIHPSIAHAGVREIKVLLSGNIRFKPDQEQPVRMKIYRAGASDGKYALIYNEILKISQKPVPVQTFKTQETRIINGVKTTVTHTTSIGGNTPSINFNIADDNALDCGSNKVFYKIKLCSESGLPLIESNTMTASLVPRPIVADDLKSWTWTPFFPGKDSLDGVFQNGKTEISVSNAPVQGQLANALTKQSRFNPPVYFKHAATQSSCWRYNRSAQSQPNSFALDATEVTPVFNKCRFFETKGQIELKSLKIDGRNVSIEANNRNVYARANGVETRLPGQKVMLNYPGTPVAELEFAYGGKTNTLSVQLPPVPTGLRAELLDDGSVKLNWDALADRIDRKQFTAPPDIKLLRDNKVIHICDINQTEFIDKQVETGKIYAYSMVLDDANAKVQFWTKEKGVTESKIMLKDLENPFPDNSKAVVCSCREKPAARPVKVSFWEPALCYERTGGPGTRLFSAAVRKLGQEADFEVLDRTSRNHVVEEKVLTMSYEKSIMIKTLPADFTVLVRDYSRQQGNGAELWLIQNKTFDYKDAKNTNFSAMHADDHFLAWRIGSVSADELKIPEKADELGDKLAAEIKRRIFFKSAPARKEASAPVKFIFNPLEAVRQKVMVIEDKAIGESIMIGLSNLLPGCSFMTREDWKAIFGEQALMREQGESLTDDISGTVLISGRVWLENDKKQYFFALSDIRSGTSIGSLQCSGTVEEVTAQLAETCKQIKPAAVSGAEVTAQTKQELDSERQKIYGCFMNRFGIINTEKKHNSLVNQNNQQEMSKPEFAQQQWQIGNRENAIKILEEMWKTNKSVGSQLSGYYYRMGNYTRSLQIVEALMQQYNKSNSLIPEYFRLRALIARNAPPEEVSKEANAPAGQEVLVGVKMNGVFHKVVPNRIPNEDLDTDFSERLAAIGQEWNPGGECRTCTKYFKFGNLKYTEYLKRDEVQKYGVWITAFEDRDALQEKHDDTYISLALWESEPFFGSNDSTILTRSLRLARSSGFPQNIIESDSPYLFDKTTFSLIRAYFAIAQNPDMKLVPLVKNYSDDSDISDDECLRMKQYAECDSIRKFLAIKLNQIIKTRQEKYRKIKLDDMICISIMAKLGSSEAEEFLSEMDTIELPKSFEELYKLQSKYEAYDLLAFKVYRGDRTACDLALKGLRAGKCCLGFRDGMADIYYLMAKAGRKEIITAMLPVTECRDKESIAAIRWANPQILKSLMLEHPEFFESDLYFYLLDGLNDPDFRDCMFNRQALLNFCSEYWMKYVLWMGRPLPELYREQTLNYKRGE